nr:integrase, catalytic region, zinc finger, CCHC-type, peptidase aspartic, catalytic [Tanacetum cinerariifolium]
MNDLLSKKGRAEEKYKITLNERCSTVLLNKIMLKEKDHGSFTISCVIGKTGIDKALVDLEASISLMLYSIYASARYGRRLQDYDNSGKMFLATAHVTIDVFNKKISFKNTLAEYMILSGADNRPPMLDEDLYDSWKIRMELYMQNREHERMILESVEHGPLIWPTVEENVAYQSPQAPTQLMTESPFVDSGFAVPVFSLGDDPIACLNKVMACLIAVASSRFPYTNNQLKTSFTTRNQATIHDGKVIVQQVQGRQGQYYSGEGHMARQCIQPKRQRNAAWYKEKTMLAEAQKARKILDEEQLAFLEDPRIPAGQAQAIIPYNAAFQTEDLDTYDSDCDDLSNAQEVLMANISIYGFDVILENQELITAELERYKERVKTFKQRFNIGLSSHEKMIDSQMDDMIKEKLALKEKKKKVDKKCLNKLNRLTEEFEKCFTPQQELLAKQAFWLRISNPTIKSSLPPIRVEVPIKLPKVSLVNESLKKLKFQLTQFDSVVKKRTIPNALTEGMFKLDLEPLAPKLMHNKECHIFYLKHTGDQADILRGLVEQAKAKQPFENMLDFACKHAKRIQELLIYVRDTYPGGIRLSNTKSNRISQPSSSNKINKVEDQSRSVKTRKNNKNRVKKVKCDNHVMQSSSNANSISVSINNAPIKNYVNDVKSGCLRAICGKCMIAVTYHKCVQLVVTKIDESKKSKSAKKHKKQNVWKPTGHVFTKVGLKWKPTCRSFTIVGNSCPLTRSTSTNVVHPKKSTSHSNEIQKLEIKVYCMKPKKVKHIGSSKIAKIVESKNANHSKPNNTWESIAIAIPSSSSLVMIGCPDCSLIARIMGYSDYQLGNVVISRVYYIEGLGHNLFSIGQFCEADLEVAFQKNTCFICDLEGVDLISGSRDTNLYTISLDDMLKSSLIYLLLKHQRLRAGYGTDDYLILTSVP